GIDYLPPVLTALAPEAETLPYGTNVSIGIGYQDHTGFTVLETGQWWLDWDGPYFNDYLVYYTGASGINPAAVNVYLNGTPITGTVNNGTFVHNAGILNPGIYNVIASVADNAGNVGSLSYTFTVTGGAPTITFTPLAGGSWWLNSTTDNTLSFTVASQNTMAQGGVVANIYTVPGNELLQGPITPTPNNNNYNIVLQGGVVPAGQTGVRLEVTATDVWGGSSTSAQVYGIDNDAPQITIHTPVAGAEFTHGSSVNITASITDGPVAKSASLSTSVKDVLAAASRESLNRTGSGLGAITLTVVKPNGTETVMTNLGAAIAETIVADMYGAYSINIVAADIAGNQSVATTNFTVLAPAPEITFHSLNGSWWINSTDDNALTFSVASAG
ncbi:MAG: hypothetical protein U1C33_08265, partial [Candidatus Cloacimonadaceae bacterium]|nr:hypothetical protein [Candidatus Cloacimonadaceae bacterium]